jgi:hypothetical protein
MRTRKPKSPKPTKEAESTTLLLLEPDPLPLRVETTRSLRAPNIAELARRGGGDPNVVAHELGVVGQQFKVIADGNSTATTVHTVVRGFEKFIAPARRFSISEVNPTPELIAATFPDIAFGGPAWIQRNIIDRCDATDHREMALDLDKIMREHHPNVGRALQDYPVVPSQLDQSVPAPSTDAKHASTMTEVARITSMRGKDWKSQRRAWLVAQVLEELQMIREAELHPDPEVPSDWDSVVQRFKGRGFYLFPAVAGSDELKTKVLGRMRGKPIGLAHAIVARREKCSVGTVRDDWKKHMPDEYRDQNRTH